MILHLYDTETVNPGDVAIGQVMSQHFTDRGIEHVQGNAFCEYPSDITVIGGGHLLQSAELGYYNGFRREGENILYSVGVSGGLHGLSYLKHYKWLVVRTQEDKNILKRATKIKRIEVYPCPANLLEPESVSFKMMPNSIGVQVFRPGYPAEYAKFLKGNVLAFPWRRSIRGRTVDDLITAQEMAERTNGEVAPTDLSPGQYMTLISQLDFFVCQSLHAAMWAYQLGIPFVVHNYHPKVLFWAMERGLRDRLFDRPANLGDAIKRVRGQKTDFDSEEDRARAYEGLMILCDISETE